MRRSQQIILTFIAIALLALLMNLGFWQLRRLREKQTMQHTFAQSEQKAPQPFTSLSDLSALTPYTLVTATGRFVVGQQFLIDNKIYKGQVGYDVITPLQLAQTGKWLLVNRGWVPAGRSRTQLPAVAVTQKTLQLKGRLLEPSRKQYTLGNGEAESSLWPMRLQKVEIAQMSKLLGHAVYPSILWLDPKTPAALQQRWTPKELSPERHLGYAVQWFALAGALLIIISLLLWRHFKHAKRTCK